MKNIFWSLCLGVCLCGCEDFLDTENFTQKNTGNFPQSVEDVNAMLTGAYAIQNTSNDVVKNHPYLYLKLLQMNVLEVAVRTVQMFRALTN